MEEKTGTARSTACPACGAAAVRRRAEVAAAAVAGVGVCCCVCSCGLEPIDGRLRVAGGATGSPEGGRGPAGRRGEAEGRAHDAALAVEDGGGTEGWEPNTLMVEGIGADSEGECDEWSGRGGAAGRADEDEEGPEGTAAAVFAGAEHALSVGRCCRFSLSASSTPDDSFDCPAALLRPTSPRIGCCGCPPTPPPSTSPSSSPSSDRPSCRGGCCCSAALPQRRPPSSRYPASIPTHSSRAQPLGVGSLSIALTCHCRPHRSRCPQAIEPIIHTAPTASAYPRTTLHRQRPIADVGHPQRLLSLPLRLLPLLVAGHSEVAELRTVELPRSVEVAGHSHTSRRAQRHTSDVALTDNDTDTHAHTTHTTHSHWHHHTHDALR